MLIGIIRRNCDRRGFGTMTTCLPLHFHDRYCVPAYSRSLKTYRFRTTLMLGASLLGLMAAAPALAQTATWTGATGDGSYSNAANWVGGIAPVGSAATAIFPLGPNNIVVIDTPSDVGTLRIEGSTNYFFENLSGGLFRVFGGFDIGTGSIARLDNTVGLTQFLGGSASTATIHNWAGATFEFQNFSSAGSASITNSGTLSFYGGSSASNAIIASTGGSISFYNASSGGNASLSLIGAQLDISAHGFGGISVASFAGDAASTINLGANTLQTGDATNTTFSGIISGAGSLVKNGTGTLTLTGANIYTGGTLLSAGTLSIGSASALGIGTLQMAGGTTLGSLINLTLGNAVTLTGGTATVDTGSSNMSLAGVVSGAGTLSKTGTGTLTLAGANTYSGGTLLSAGTLAIGSASALGTGTLQMAGGTTLGSLIGLTLNNAVTLTSGTATVDTGSSNMSLAGVVSGAGTLSKTGTGTLTLAGANTYTGATWIQEGTLRMSGIGTLSNQTAVQVSAGAVFDLGGITQTVGSLSGTGDVLVGGTTLVAGGNNSSTTFSGAISGAGSFVKNGTGTLTLNGTNTYTSVTQVAGGRLVVDGSVTSPVIVLVGATLGGSGSVGAATVGGTLSPGNSPGTLTVNGNLVMGVGSTYVAEVQGAVADRVNVTGTALLAGTLRIGPLGGAYLFNSPYTLLSAAGGRTGTFSPVDTTGSFGDGVTTTVGYTATEVQLTLTPKPLAPIVVPPSSSPRLGIAAPLNAYAVASAIDGAVANGTDASPLFNLYNQPASAIPAAVNQLSGEVHAGVPALGFQAASQFLGTMLDPNGRGRLAGAAGGPHGVAGFTADLPSKQSAAGPASFDPARFSLWGATFGSRGRTDGERSVGSANRTLDDAHLAVGADVLLAPGTVAGFALAAGQARASLSGGLGKIESDVFQAGLYGLTRIGPVDLAAAGGYARLDNDIHRAVPVLGNALTSSYASTAWSGRLQASAQLASWNGVTLSPLAALQAVHVSSPAVVERAGLGGNAGALSIAGRNDTTSRSELGVQLDGRASFGAVPVTGFVRAAWAHYFQRDASLTASLIALPGASFSASGARPDQDSALIAAGLDARLTERVSLGIRLDSELSTNTRSLGGTARLAVSF